MLSPSGFRPAVGRADRLAAAAGGDGQMLSPRVKVPRAAAHLRELVRCGWYPAVVQLSRVPPGPPPRGTATPTVETSARLGFNSRLQAGARPRGRRCLGHEQSGLFGTFRAYGAYGATVESDNASARTNRGSTVGGTCGTCGTCGSGRRCGRCRHDERSCRRCQCGWQLVVAATAKSGRQNNCSRATEQRKRLTSLRFH
jgi:hypothetical protein